MVKPIRLAITGASGQSGYSLVFRVAAGGMLGPEQPVSLHLLELPENQDRLHALELELKDCAFPLLADLRIGTDPFEIFREADWIILLPAHPLHKGQTQFDLLRQNGPYFVEYGRAINKASPTARILVAANPTNTNCLIAKSHAQDVPAEHWFAMNRVRWMRATAMVAEKAGVPVSHVTGVTIWGNASPSAYIDLHNAHIDHRPVSEIITDRAWVREVLEPTIAHRSAEILDLCGHPPAGTIAQAVLGTIRSITTPTPFGRRICAAVVSDGSYGVPRGLIFGFPLYTEDGRSWSICQGLYLDSYALERIAANIAEIEHEAMIVSNLLGTV
ncbi:MAG: malate dehydrogenase [Isosphaeraceae bacterium]|nr:malate dehydrogenase [Isosphaeraceae bacterium]